MNAKEVCDYALAVAKDKGYKIIRGGCVFDYRGGKIYGCNLNGAILLLQERPEIFMQQGWLKEVYTFLGVNGLWLFRVTMGFDYGTEIRLMEEKENMLIEIGIDDISRFGNKLAKKYSK